MTTPSKASQRMVPVDVQQPPQDRSGDVLGTPGGVTGPQGLGEAIRGLGTHASVPGEYADAIADRADDLQRTVDSLNDEATRQSETIGRVRDLADEIEHAAEFIGVHRKTLVRKIRQAVDGAE
jgi:chemotaxis regulatin CheY-phosphate phosphatase CheZ